MAIRCPGCGKFLSAKDEKCSNCGTILKKGAVEEKVEKPVAKVEAPAKKVEVREVEEEAPEILRKSVVVTRYVPYESVKPADFSGPSYFDGRFIQYLGWFLLGALVTLLTAGILYPLAYAWLVRWECKHTVTSGYRQVFNGKPGSLIPRWLLWYFLTIITLTIYGWWNPIRFRKWKVARIKLVKDPKAK